MGSQVHDGLELEALEGRVVQCNHPDCWDVEKQKHRQKATRFFKTKRDQTYEAGGTPAPGEKMYFGRCDEHGDPKVLNYELVEECSREEYMVADVMQS